MTVSDKIAFKVFRGKAEDMPIQRHDGYIYFTIDEGKFYIDTKTTNGIVKRILINDNKKEGIFSNTKINWDSQPFLVSEKNFIYIYTDYQKDSQGNNIPGIKIGDGKTYLINVPFFENIPMQHMKDKDVHVTLQEKDFWNNKVRCQFQNQRLTFTTD